VSNLEQALLKARLRNAPSKFTSGLFALGFLLIAFAVGLVVIAAPILLVKFLVWLWRVI
jgi:hypothetical protein